MTNLFVYETLNNTADFREWRIHRLLNVDGTLPNVHNDAVNILLLSLMVVKLFLTNVFGNYFFLSTISALIMICEWKQFYNLRTKLFHKVNNLQKRSLLSSPLLFNCLLWFQLPALHKACPTACCRGSGRMRRWWWRSGVVSSAVCVRKRGWGGDGVGRQEALTRSGKRQGGANVEIQDTTVKLFTGIQK